MRPSCDVAPRARQAGDAAAPNRIANKPDDDGDCRGGVLGSEGRGRGRGEDEVHLAAHELSRELGELIALPFGVSDLNRDVLALDPAELAESLSECLQEGRTRGGRSEF